MARLSEIQRAPILHHFAESLAGAATIHAFDQEDRFTYTNLGLVDNHSRPWFHNMAAMEWLSFRLNILSNFVFACTLVVLVSLPEGIINPSKYNMIYISMHIELSITPFFFPTLIKDDPKRWLTRPIILFSYFTDIAGLAVTYGINLNVLQASIIWNMCNAENKMISVERILQYSNLPSEAPLTVEENRPPHKWPDVGTISFNNLQVSINAEERIGSVGQTYQTMLLNHLNCVYMISLKTTC